MGDNSGYQKGTRVYVGGLSEGIKKEDLETEFEKFGKLNSVWVAFNPPGFAFVEFSNKTDAENACDSMNGTELLGGKLRVELSRSRGRGGFRNGSGFRGRGAPRGGYASQGSGGFMSRGRGTRPNGGGGRGGPGVGGPWRGGFARGRDYNRNGNFGSYGGGEYGGGDASYGMSYTAYDGGDGTASASYRSRSPITAGGGPNRQY